MGGDRYDAVVVGAGPNGLAAAVTMARAGCSVLVIEAEDTIGGGARSAELTLPGFVHDVCSAVHPLAAGSPVFARWPLAEHGLEFVYPPLELAHPLDDAPAAVIERSLERTADWLDDDGPAWKRLMGPLAGHWPEISGVLYRPWTAWRAAVPLARMALPALRSADGVARSSFRGERARALFAGLAAHSIVPLTRPLTSTFGVALGGMAHAAGWPVVRGGSQRIADALASYLRSLGGAIVTGTRVSSLADLPPARARLLDLTPRQIASIAGDALPGRYRRAMQRFRYGPGVFKVDYALDGPVPWSDPACLRAGTLHLGGTLGEIVEEEAAVARGEHPDRPFLLVAQPSLFDDTRAPAGKHTLWAYCHVPNSSTVDMTERIDAQIERFAPGFSSRVLARSTTGPAEVERLNANHVGGDIAGGSNAGLRMLARPGFRLVPYATPVDGLYLCSSSTPPGAGVHGVCGYLAARVALRRMKAGLRTSRGV